MDIRPPRRPRPQPPELPSPVTRDIYQDNPPHIEPATTSIATLNTNSDHDPVAKVVTLKSSHRGLRLIFLIIAITVLVIASALLYFWWSLQPVGGDSVEQRVTISSGESLEDIARNLKNHRLIRNAFTFELYARAIRAYPDILAGGYVLSNSQSSHEIIQKLMSGEKHEFTVTIAPGLTLEELADVEVEHSLASQGFTRQEIITAYESTYDSALLKDKPKETSIEGYIFPETYQMSNSQTLNQVFERTFEELYKRMRHDKLPEAFAANGLNLHQAITLASIVQKEVKDETEQKQVAQVFLGRLKKDMVLGSDVTFMYAAKKMGVPATVDLESPYNTRKYPGLPPGPISNMNYSALLAVAFPAPGDYLYFVAGDDGKTYFARTEQEHNANVAAHCTTLCQ